MSRFGERNAEFGSENARAYYKAQAPPGGKSNFSLGGGYEPEPVKKNEPKIEEKQAEDKEASKENTPRDSNSGQQNSGQKTDPNEHKARAKAMQQSSIFGGPDTNSNQANGKKHYVKELPNQSGKPEAVLPKPQLDMKTNEYPSEEKKEEKVDNKHKMNVGYRVKQPPGGASSGLW